MLLDERQRGPIALAAAATDATWTIVDGKLVT